MMQFTVLLLLCLALQLADRVAAVESGAGYDYSGDTSGGGDGTSDSPCARLQQPQLPFCFEYDNITVSEDAGTLALELVPNGFEFEPFLQIYIAIDTADGTAIAGQDFTGLDEGRMVGSLQPFTAANLDILDDETIDDALIKEFTVLVHALYTTIDDEEILASTSLVVFITDDEGVPSIACPRDLSCAIGGQISADGSSIELSGDVLTCSPPHSTTGDTTEIDSTFEAEFMSAGSLLFLQQLDIISRDEGTIPCNVSASVQPYGDPTVVLHSLGVEALTLLFSESSGFNSLTFSLPDLQSLVVSGDYSAGGALTEEASQSLHWLLHQLTQSPSLPASSCRGPLQAGTTVVSLLFNCN
jgi:hypothetical protein